MPSRTPRGLVRRTAKRPTISDGARRVVEDAYGRRLRDPIWEQIKASTNRFASDEQFTPTLKELRQRLETLSRAAHYFERQVPKGISGSTSLNELHRQTLKELRVLGLETATAIPYLQILAQTCRILADYCVRNPECLDALSRDDLWDIWISDLTDIIQKEGLPSGARKDSDKNAGQASPFVRLVSALQRYISKSRRRFAHSLDGLATGINRGRKNWRMTERELLAGHEHPSD